MNKAQSILTVVAFGLAGMSNVAGAAPAAGSGTSTTARSPGPAAEVPAGARTRSRTAVGAPGTMPGSPTDAAVPGDDVTGNSPQPQPAPQPVTNTSDVADPPVQGSSPPPR